MDISKRISKGLLAILPIIISIWIFSFVYNIIESIFAYLFGITDNNLPATIFIFSMSILLLYYMGYLVEKNREFLLLKFTELVIDKIPVFKSIYSAIKEIVSLFSSDKKDNYLGVCYIKLGPTKMIGFITKKNGTSLNIFVPTTPNPTTGLLVIVEESEVEMTNMDVSDGFKKIMSLGTK